MLVLRIWLRHERDVYERRGACDEREKMMSPKSMSTVATRVFMGVVAVGCVGVVGVLGAAASSASESVGGLEVDRQVIDFHDLAPATSQDGYVQLTNTTDRLLFISAVTMKSKDIEGINLNYVACAVPWVDGVCAAESLTVGDYDLSALPAEVKTLDYAISSGHTTFFKLVASMAPNAVQQQVKTDTQLTFKWVAVDVPPVGVVVDVMPSSSTLVVEPITPPVDPTESPVDAEVIPVGIVDQEEDTTADVVADGVPVKQETLARTGVDPIFLYGGTGAFALVIAGISAVVVRARMARSHV